MTTAQTAPTVPQLNKATPGNMGRLVSNFFDQLTFVPTQGARTAALYFGFQFLRVKKVYPAIGDFITVYGKARDEGKNVQQAFRNAAEALVPKVEGRTDLTIDVGDSIVICLDELFPLPKKPWHPDASYAGRKKRAKAVRNSWAPVITKLAWAIAKAEEESNSMTLIEIVRDLKNIPAVEDFASDIREFYKRDKARGVAA